MDLRKYWSESTEALHAWGGRLDRTGGSQGTARDHPEPSIYVARSGFDTARLRGAYAPRYRPKSSALPAPAARPSLYRKIYDDPIGPIWRAVIRAHVFPPAPRPMHPPERPTFAEIRQTVCGFQRVSFQSVVSARRNVALVTIRGKIIFLAWALTPMSLPQIGLKLNRDHTTILYSIRKTCRAEGIDYDRTDIAATIARQMFEEMWRDAACNT